MHVPNGVMELCEQLHKAGYRAWVVGGCTRDRLLGRPVTDWDLATDARPEDVGRVFRRVIPTGLRHGTVTVLLGGCGFEVTTLRGEGAYTDGRHPDWVRYVDDLQEDLARRDFTVNAIAYDPLGGEWIDPFGGRRDLENRLVRAVGQARDRFEEDGLRIMRAARFVATLGFSLEDDTWRAMEQTVERLRCVSWERLRDELVKTLLAPVPSRGLEVMMQVGIMGRVIPELEDAVGCEQNAHHSYDVWKHTLVSVDRVQADVVLRTAMLLHDVGKPKVRAIHDKRDDYTFFGHEVEGAQQAWGILRRLRYSNDDRRRIVHLIRHHLVLYESHWTDAAVRRWVRRVGQDAVADLLAMARADAHAKGASAQVLSQTLSKLEELEARVRALRQTGMALGVKDLVLDGRDVMRQLGIGPGPLVGEVLAYLMELVMEDPTRNEREQLQYYARHYMQDRATGQGLKAETSAVE